MIYKTPEKINAIEAEKISNELYDILNSGQDVIIDMSQTTYIASAGLRSLIMTLKRAKIKQLDFCVCNPSPQVIEILKITGLSELIPTYEYLNKNGRLK